MDKNNLVEIIPLNIHLDKTFYYRIPTELINDAEIGKRVIIPFRNRQKTGLILSFALTVDIPNIKEIVEIIDPLPIISKGIFQLIEWISEYYVCPKGIVINQIVPSKVSQKKIELYMKHIILEEKQITRKQWNDYRKEIYYKEQENIKWKEKDKEGKVKKPTVFWYCHKTIRDRYYNILINKTLKMEKQILILIPDQWSCNELKRLLITKYGKIVGIFDKHTSQTEKYSRLLSVLSGEKRIVIGTRSNIFLPFPDLGLIIVEQEPSDLYKEERRPQYNARDLALQRGKIEKIKIILGSSVPSIETYWKMNNGEYKLRRAKDIYKLTEKRSGINIIDMNKQKSYQHIISFPLQQQIIDCLKKGQQVVLFLNRRGYARYMICSECGFIVKCPQCNQPLTYHIESGIKWSVCHHCGKKVKITNDCPQCENGYLKPLGIGTQSVETLVKKMFPKANIQRMDTDVTPKIINQKKIIHHFNQKKIDILIGTQILFNHLDLKKVSLFGVILADHLLNIPDYRSTEQTFRLFFQVALELFSNSGDAQHKLYIQTFRPENDSIKAIREMDYSLFYDNEIIQRNELEYPPFATIIKIELVSEKLENLEKKIFHFIRYADEHCLISRHDFGYQLHKDNVVIKKVGGKTLSTFLLKISNEEEEIRSLKEKLYQYILKYREHDVKLTIDVDPIKMS